MRGRVYLHLDTRDGRLPGGLPDVASSDATNIETRIRRDGNEYVIQGRKWWTSAARDPRCKILIVMGQSDPDNLDRYRRQSTILVPLPHPDVVVKRMLPVFGYDEAPHGRLVPVFRFSSLRQITSLTFLVA